MQKGHPTPQIGVILKEGSVYAWHRVGESQRTWSGADEANKGLIAEQGEETSVEEEIRGSSSRRSTHLSGVIFVK